MAPFEAQPLGIMVAANRPLQTGVDAKVELQGTSTCFCASLACKDFPLGKCLSPAPPPPKPAAPPLAIGGRLLPPRGVATSPLIPLACVTVAHPPSSQITPR